MAGGCGSARGRSSSPRRRPPRRSPPGSSTMGGEALAGARRRRRRLRRRRAARRPRGARRGSRGLGRALAVGLRRRTAQPDRARRGRRGVAASSAGGLRPSRSTSCSPTRRAPASAASPSTCSRAPAAPAIVLVSCDAGALGRDARLLGERGYRFAGAAMVDAVPAHAARRGRQPVRPRREGRVIQRGDRRRTGGVRDEFADASDTTPGVGDRPLPAARAGRGLPAPRRRGVRRSPAGSSARRRWPRRSCRRSSCGCGTNPTGSTPSEARCAASCSPSAHGRSVDLLRSDHARRRREERDERVVRTTASGDYDVEHQVWDMALADQVRAALDALPASERQAIELAYFGGHTYREVAVDARRAPRAR